MVIRREFLILAVIAALIHQTGVSARRHSLSWSNNSGKHSRRELRRKEYLTPAQQNNTEVLAQVGGTATIKCYTHFLGDEMVTWLKKDEDRLLTAGGQVYSSENRYSIAHVRHQKLWELSVRDVRLSDAGVYECQITTHPKTSLFFILNVVEARAVIHGEPDVHVHTGERLRLTCSVEHATQLPAYIFWFHNNSMINYAPRRPLRVIKHHIGSSLIVSNVTWEDAGSYACEPHKAESVNITLHVVAGEKHAALHNSGKGEGDSADDPTVVGGGSDSQTTSGGSSFRLHPTPHLMLPTAFLVLLFTYCWGIISRKMCGNKRMSRDDCFVYQQNKIKENIKKNIYNVVRDTAVIIFYRSF